MNISFTALPTQLQFGVNALAEHLGVTLGGGHVFTVRQEAGSDLIVTLEESCGTITYSEPCHFFRAFGLAVEQLQQGNNRFSLREVPQFRMNGPMFDVSQGNAAFRTDTLKSVIRQLALMGLNTLMLYCEDSYEVKSQPYFGYMRARYSEEQMRELDEYAWKLGIEMIPCIQTLAHLPEPLRWNVFAGIRDYDSCLLVGKEQTYAFIRDLIISATRPFRTKKIHIGMDEAWALGRGRYIDEFGYCPSDRIMAEHLQRVSQILRELELEPMMWDDMFFRAYGVKDYFQLGAVLPPEASDAVPQGMKCIYWDYYHLKESEYEDLMKRHLQLSKGNTIFAGGIWTWTGFGLAWTKTKICAEAALNVCKRLGVRDVFMTAWGDNGTEALLNTTLIGCQLYAEHGYSEAVDYDKFAKRFHFCTGGRVEDFEKLERLDRNPMMAQIPDSSEYNASKYLMWQDILTGLCDKNIAGWELDAHYEALAQDLLPAAKRNGQFNGMFRFSQQAAHVLAMKSQMGLRLTAAYKAGDRQALEHFASEALPELRNRVIALRKVHMENWFSLYKPFGWDVMDLRYGGLIIRITSAIEELRAYLDGSLQRIEELEDPRLYYDGKPGAPRFINAYSRVVSPSNIAANT